VHCVVGALACSVYVHRALRCVCCSFANEGDECDRYRRELDEFYVKNRDQVLLSPKSVSLLDGM
jgi:hypothetical protein